MVTFVFESYNDEYEKYDSNNWPKDWIIDGKKIKPFNSYAKQLPELPYYFYNKIKCKLYSELSEGEKYFYPILIDNVNYFRNMKANGLSFNLINEKIINDIRNNRAKLILLLANESSNVWDYIILNKWCKEFNITKDQVYYFNGNYLGPKFCENFNFTAAVSNEMLAWNKPIYLNKISYTPESEKNLYLSYNRRERPHRTILVCELIKNNLLSRGYVSYKGNEKTLEKLYESVKEIGRSDLLNEAKELYDMSPLTLDVDDLEKINPTWVQDISYYEKTFLSLVTETSVDINALYFTEKTWKTICVGHPFLLISNKHALKKLKELGFKTYDKWFDETYDDLNDINDRIQKITSEIIRLSHLDTEQLIEIRKEMQDTIKHNQIMHLKYYTGLMNLDDEFGVLGQLNRIWQTF